MAISIDTVYQRVLALANKEQRGYITPQEFNLLAGKAQLDIFNQYFHDYKTAILSPGNQTESSDDADLIREKIASHRFSGAAIPIDANGLGSIANNTHWLESIYSSEVGGRSIVLTIDDTWSSDHDGNTIALRAFYDGTGGLFGESSYGLYLNHNGSDVDGDMVTISGGCHIDVTGGTVSVAASIANAINKNSPYHSATRVDNVITIMYLQVDKVFNNAETLVGLLSSTNPSTLMTLSTATTITNSGSNVYEEVNLMDVQYIKSNKKLNPTSASRGMYYREGTSQIRVLPAVAGNLKHDYIKKPSNPGWNYVVVGEKALYNPSGSIDFELHPSEESNLTNKILELAGIVINKPGLSEVILRNQAVKEAKENK